MRKLSDKLWAMAVLVLTILVPHSVHAQSSSCYVLQWGPQGFVDGQYDITRGVDIDANGYVYMANINSDAGTDRYCVEKFTRFGEYVTQFGEVGAGPGQFNQPHGLAVDDSGYVYVADYFNSRIEKFTDAGVFVAQLGSPGAGDGQLAQPVAVATDHNGHVFVTDTENGRIEKFTSSGVYLSQWGGFNRPQGIAVDPTGNVYVSDTWNNQIVKYTNDGVFITEWGHLGSGDGELNLPVGLTVDGAGGVYVVEYGNNRIQKFNSFGGFIGKWGSSGSGNGQFNIPFDIVVDDSGFIYVSDGGNHRVQKFSPCAPLVGVEPSVLSTRLVLAPPHPNPSRDRTKLDFSLIREDRVRLAIYDLQGRRLKQWSWPSLSAGWHHVSWDGVTDEGRHSRTGILYVRLDANGQSLKQKLIHLH